MMDVTTEGPGLEWGLLRKWSPALRHAAEAMSRQHAEEVERLCMLAAPIGRDPRGCMRLEYRAGERLPRVVVEGSE